MDAPWWTGNDNAPGLDPEPDYERAPELRCASCAMPIERVSIVVDLPPFQQPLVVCGELCEADLKAKVEA